MSNRSMAPENPSKTRRRGRITTKLQGNNKRAPVLLANEIDRRKRDLHALQEMHTRLLNSSMATGTFLAESFIPITRSSAAEIRERYTLAMKHLHDEKNQVNSTLGGGGKSSNDKVRLPSLEDSLKYISSLEPNGSSEKEGQHTLSAPTDVVKLRQLNRKSTMMKSTRNRNEQQSAVVLSSLTPRLKAKLKRLPRPNTKTKEKLGTLGQHFMELIADGDVTNVDLAGSLYDTLLKQSAEFARKTEEEKVRIVSQLLQKKKSSRKVVASKAKSGYEHLAGLRLPSFEDHLKTRNARTSVYAVPRIQLTSVNPTHPQNLVTSTLFNQKSGAQSSKQQTPGSNSPSPIRKYKQQLNWLERKKLRRDLEISELMNESRKFVPRDIILSQGIQRFVKRSGMMRLQYVVTRLAFRHTGEAFDIWKSKCQSSRAIQEEASARVIQRAWIAFVCALEMRERRSILLEQIDALRTSTQSAIVSRAAAAVTVQCAVRVYQARSFHHVLLHELEAIKAVQRSWRVSRSKVILALLRLRQLQREQASVEIQRVFRGYRGRERAKMLRKVRLVAKKTALQAERREAVHQELRRLGAATCLQQWWRGQLRRNYTRAMVMVRKRRNMIKLQSWWRMIMGKKELLHRLELREQHRVRRVEATQHIQRIYRGHRGREAVRAILAGRERERQDRLARKEDLLQDRVMVIRNKLVGERRVNLTKPKRALFAARQRLDPWGRRRRGGAATKVQAVWRGFRARRRVRMWIRKQHLEKRARRKMDAVQSAVLLQRQFRGLVERRRVHKVVQAKTAVKLQALFRGQKTRKVVFALAEKHYAASKIQACWRGSVHRPLYEVVRVQRSLHARMGGHIQRFYRGFDARVRQVPKKLDRERLLAEFEQMGAKGFARAVAKYTDRNMVETAFLPEEGNGKRKRKKRKPAGLDPSTGGCQLVFNHWAHATNGLTSDRFAKFVKLTPGLIKQRNLDSTAVDILFVRVKKNSKLKTISVPQFVQALCELSAVKLRIADDAEKKELFEYRGFKGNKGLLLYMFARYIWNAPWAAPVLEEAQRATIANMNTSAMRIQSVIRGALDRWRFRELVKQHKHHLEQERVAQCATRIQNLWRKRKARKLLDVQAAAVIERYVIQETGEVYWFNKVTQKTQWETPSYLAEYERMSVKPRTIVLPDPKEEFMVECSVCNKAPGRFTCDQCLDPFCDLCFRSTHKRGNKAGHTITEIRMCAECDYQAATRICLACPSSSSLFCCTCYGNCHQQGTETEGHKWTAIVVPCSECEDRAAKIQCRGCDDDVFCLMCFEAWHAKGHRASHHFRPVRYMTHEVHAKYELQRVKEKVDREQQRLAEIQEAKDQERLEWAATKLQAAFRSRKIRFYGKRFMKKKRKKLRAFYAQGKVDAATKQTLGYIVKDLVGQAPVLETDDEEARARKAKGWKGTKWGNTVVKAAELASLPQGELLPGTATVWRNYYGIGTTCDLSKMLEEGDWVRIGMQAFQVAPTKKVPMTSKLVPIDHVFVMSETEATLSELQLYKLPPLTVAQVSYVTSKRAIATSSAFRAIHDRTDQGRKRIHFQLTGIGETLGGRSNILGKTFLTAAKILGKEGNLDTVQIQRHAKSPWITHKDHATGKVYYVNPTTGVTTFEKPQELKTKVQLRKEEKEKHDAENNINSTTVKHSHALKRLQTKKLKQSKRLIGSPFTAPAQGLSGTTASEQLSEVPEK